MTVVRALAGFYGLIRLGFFSFVAFGR